VPSGQQGQVVCGEILGENGKTLILSPISIDSAGSRSRTHDIIFLKLINFYLKKPCGTEKQHPCEALDDSPLTAFFGNQAAGRRHSIHTGNNSMSLTGAHQPRLELPTANLDHRIE